MSMTIDMEEEIWKDVQGFEGYYQVSSYGRLKSFKKVPTGRVLKNTNSKGDYFRIVLDAGGNKLHTSVHRLVATHFIPNPDSLPVVNHKDGNKQNNRIDNLEWCTHAYNTADSIQRNPHVLDGMKKYNRVTRPKPVTQFKDGWPYVTYSSAKAAEMSTGICARNILQVANKTPYRNGLVRKTAGGYVWMFLEDWYRKGGD